MTEKKAVAARVDALENQVRNVACLANATAKGVGKDKVQRQWVAFTQGPCRAKLEEAWAGWKEGASRAKEGGAAAASSKTKVVPFKLQVFNLLVEQLAEQGLDQERFLGGCEAFGRRTSWSPCRSESRQKMFRRCGSSCFCFVRRGEVCLSVSQLLRSPAVLQTVAKKGGVYPPLGLRPGRFIPGEYQRKVLEDLGHTPDDVKAWFGGKGSAGSGKGSQGGSGLGKRAAGTRLSLVEEREKKR